MRFFLLVLRSRFTFQSVDMQLKDTPCMLWDLSAYLDRELSAERLVGICAANEKAIGALSAEYSYVVLALVVAAALQVAKLAVRLGAGPLQSLKQVRSSKHYYQPGLGRLRVHVAPREVQRICTAKSD